MFRVVFWFHNNKDDDDDDDDDNCCCHWYRCQDDTKCCIVETVQYWLSLWYTRDITQSTVGCNPLHVTWNVTLLCMVNGDLDLAKPNNNLKYYKQTIASLTQTGNSTLKTIRILQTHPGYNLFSVFKKSAVLNWVARYAMRNDWC